MKENFVSYLISEYPNLSETKIRELISENLVSPFKVQLPRSVLNDIQTQIKQIYELRSWSEHNLAPQFEQKNLPKAKNFSVCTSYDFHVTDNQLKLIEINTNAAFLALGLNLYKCWNLDNSTGFNTESLVKMFKDESVNVGETNLNIAIMDEQPINQRLFIEFLVFQQILNAKIIDISEVNTLAKGTLIYNRYTDFYLEDEKSKSIRDLYSKNHIHLSPSPWEYFLLADKQRLFDWQQQTELPIPSSLLKIYDLTQSDKDLVWNERKKLFFKPKSSYGSKQVYKGASMSRRIFDEAFSQGFIAQELAPPSEIEVDLKSEPHKFKYDLRCYAYKDQLQLVIARLYQGQTTNLQTFGGGFTVVEFV